eukprot:Trichotokara_eunicae@DN8923_c0_g1_i1.p1
MMYKSNEELLDEMVMAHECLREDGHALIASGTLLDLIRQLRAFGLHLLKLDIRQEASVHTNLMDQICLFVGLGSYVERTEEEKQKLLTDILKHNRPFVPRDYDFLPQKMKDILETFKITAELGIEPFGAYVISMCMVPSDVLLVEVFQKEFRGNGQTQRVVPLLETIEALKGAKELCETLFENEVYREILKTKHNDVQEAMVGYSD